MYKFIFFVVVGCLVVVVGMVEFCDVVGIFIEFFVVVGLIILIIIIEWLMIIEGINLYIFLSFECIFCYFNCWVLYVYIVCELL